jgi:hypothetical protein
VWWAGCKASIYISESMVLAGMIGHEPTCWAGVPWQQALPQAATLLRQLGHRRVDVWLSGGLSRPFIVPVAEGLKRRADLEQLAKGIAADLTHMPATADVWVGDWRKGHPTLACATEPAVMAAVNDLPKSHGLQARSISPLWAWVANECADTCNLLFVSEPGACTVLQSDHDHVVAASSHVPCPVGDGIVALVARTSFARGVATESAAIAEVSPLSGTLAKAKGCVWPPVTVVWRAA